MTCCARSIAGCCRRALGLIAKRQPDLLFVRLSRDSVLDGTLVEWLDGQLKATLAEPQRLCVQFTEEVATRYPQPLRHLLEELRKRRVKSALEDFGRGPDSLGLLEALGDRLPEDRWLA